MAMNAMDLPPWTGATVAIPNVSELVAEAVLRPSTCVPDGAVLLSYVNPTHQKLRA